MSNWTEILFGNGKDLDALQMSMRSITLFVIGLFLLRVAGRRTFGLRTAFDVVITLIFGGLLARAIVGVSPVGPVIAACATIAVAHRLFAWLAMRSKAFGFVIKGSPIVLYEHGRLNESSLARCQVSHDDLKEVLRLRGVADLADTERITMERNGEISVIPRSKK